MSDLLAIGAVVAKVLSLVGDEVLKGGVTEATKDAYAALKKRLSGASGPKPAPRGAQPSEFPPDSAVAEDFDALPGHGQAAVVELTKTLLQAMVLGSEAMSDRHPWLTLEDDLREAVIVNRVGSQVQSGSNSIQAGRDVVINQAAKSEGRLEIVKVGFTRDCEFDVIVRNTGDTDAVIHEIKVTKLYDDDLHVSPILRPSARYKIDVGSITVGQSRKIDVAHVVEARKADRFLIALDATSVFLLEVELIYDDQKVTGFTKRTFDQQEKEDTLEAVAFSRWFDRALREGLEPGSDTE